MSIPPIQATVGIDSTLIYYFKTAAEYQYEIQTAEADKLAHPGDLQRQQLDDLRIKIAQKSLAIFQDPANASLDPKALQEKINAAMSNLFRETQAIEQDRPDLAQDDPVLFLLN